jgi:hypothetical protein
MKRNEIGSTASSPALELVFRTEAPGTNDLPERLEKLVVKPIFLADGISAKHKRLSLLMCEAATVYNMASTWGINPYKRMGLRPTSSGTTVSHLLIA